MRFGRSLWLALPLALLSGSSSSASFLRIIGDSGPLPFGPGSGEHLQIISNERITVRTVEFAITWDASRLFVDRASFRAGAKQSGPIENRVRSDLLGLETLVYDPGNPDIDGSLGSVSGTLTASGAGFMFSPSDPIGQVLAFSIAPALRPFGGIADVNLRANFAGVTTRINGGAIVLDPPPTDGFDVGRDVRLSVTAVPEPAGVVLLGLGSLVAVAWRRRRAG